MTWEVVAGLLLKYGPEVVDFVVKKWNTRGPVAVEEWAELYALATKTPESQLLDALARNNLSPDSEQAKALLALLK
jgi:hypothetical protein